MPSKLCFSRAIVAALFGLAAFMAVPADAQQWPAKPITIVNGFPAGAGNDIVHAHVPGGAGEGPRYPAGVRIQARRRRQRRLRVRRPRRARRLHLPDRHGRHPRHQCRALQEAALRRRGRLHADRAAGRRSQRAGGQSHRHRRQDGAGVHRRGEGGARQVQLRLDRQRRQHAPGLRPVQCGCGPRHGARALQGQSRGDPGAGNGRGVLHLRPGADGAGPVSRRQGPAAGRQHQVARRHPARRADDRRGRAAGLRERHLVRPDRPQGARSPRSPSASTPSVRKAQEKPCPAREAGRHRHVRAQRDAWSSSAPP